MLFLRLTFLCFFSTFCSHFIQAQQGCTDPIATNYDALATENNGSCTYDNPLIIPKTRSELPGSIMESSGMVYRNETLFSHNDSGDDPAIYAFTTDGTLTNTYTLNNAKNTDWEALTSDDSHLYIGDFGNNFGLRKDLTIYKIQFDSLAANNNIEKQVISYTNQKSFPFKFNNHPFDCEAMVYMDSSLFLFSKNWKNPITYVYEVSTDFGADKALSPIDSFEFDGLITDACVFDDSTLVLTSYKKGVTSPKLLVLKDIKNQSFSTANKYIVPLNVGSNNQIEAITKADDDGVFFTNERDNGKGYLFYIDIMALLSNTTTAVEEETVELPACGVQPNPIDDRFFVDKNYHGDGQLLNFQGQKVSTFKMNGEMMTLPDSIQSGIYNLIISKEASPLCKEKVFIY